MYEQINNLYCIKYYVKDMFVFFAVKIHCVVAGHDTSSTWVRKVKLSL
jgi:hypothetical protein